MLASSCSCHILTECQNGHCKKKKKEDVNEGLPALASVGVLTECVTRSVEATLSVPPVDVLCWGSLTVRTFREKKKAHLDSVVRGTVYEHRGPFTASRKST